MNVSMGLINDLSMLKEADHEESGSDEDVALFSITTLSARNSEASQSNVQKNQLVLEDDSAEDIPLVQEAEPQEPEIKEELPDQTPIIENFPKV